jgi:acyl carrier protein phosphodiesterase
MNYLAHAYLSFNDPDVLAGNMISDFIKGSARYSYSQGIQRGIELHRAIDQFTDTHPVTHEAKQIFRPHYRLYSGPIMDIIYDHFLANDPNTFSLETLSLFTTAVYSSLESVAFQLPIRFVQMLTYMKTEDWLLSYGRNEGIQRSLRGLSRRATYMVESETAFRLFLDQYDQLYKLSQDFIPDVKNFAKQRYNELI